jgi:hypothetical protein
MNLQGFFVLYDGDVIGGGRSIGWDGSHRRDVQRRASTRRKTMPLIAPMTA